MDSKLLKHLLNEEAREAKVPDDLLQRADPDKDAERINFIFDAFGSDVPLGTQIRFLRWMDERVTAEIARERAEIADEIKAALAGEFIDASPSAFRSRFHTIEAKLRAKL